MSPLGQHVPRWCPVDGDGSITALLLRAIQWSQGQQQNLNHPIVASSGRFSLQNLWFMVDSDRNWAEKHRQWITPRKQPSAPSLGKQKTALPSNRIEPPRTNSHAHWSTTRRAVCLRPRAFINKFCKLIRASLSPGICSASLPIRRERTTLPLISSPSPSPSNPTSPRRTATLVKCSRTWGSSMRP